MVGVSSSSLLTSTKICNDYSHLEPKFLGGFFIRQIFGKLHPNLDLNDLMQFGQSMICKKKMTII